MGRGGGSPSSTVTNAINNAVNNGRNYKGCIVLFSSGNDSGGNGTSVSYPAKLDKVIAVGATSMCDERKSLSSCDDEIWGSNYGSELDVVAPGVEIFTTDISGTPGYTTAEYISYFNGTSAACPNVAGVVALILSAKPNLTQQQVRDILETTTDKTGGYAYTTTSGHPNGTWNNEMGYGRVNAKKAMEKALFDNTYISGSNSVCFSNTIYNLVNPPSGYAVSWQVSSNLQIVSSSSTQVTVKTTNSVVTGSGYVKANISGYEITKNVWVGSFIPADLRLRDPSTNNPVYFICYLQSTTVKATHDSGTVPDSWQWSVSGASVTYPYSSNNSLATLHPYSYNITVKIKAHNDCGWSDWADVTPDVIPCGMYFTVSPNPAQSEITITPAESTTDEANISNTNDTQNRIPVDIELYDIIGIKVKQTAFNMRDPMTMDVSRLRNGIYFLKIIVGDYIETHQLVIH